MSFFTEPQSHTRKHQNGRVKIRVLFMDHHKAHFTKKVKKAFFDAFTILLPIPKHLTSVLQLLDKWFWLVRHFYVQHGRFIM